MCYLPKATFYIYFGFFFCGYLWIFGLLFYRTLGRTGYIRNQYNPVFYNIPLFDSEENYVRSLLYNFHASLPDQNFIKSMQVFDTTIDASNAVDSNKESDGSAQGHWCVETRTEPQRFNVCLHNPLLDTGVSAHLHMYRVWEPELTKIVVELLKNASEHATKPFFIDIGANIGYYSLLAAKLGYRVIAVEPFADNLYRLHEALVDGKLNDAKMLGRIIALEAAVFEYRVNLTFVHPRSNTGARFALVRSEERLKYATSPFLYAPAVLLDDLLWLLPNDTSTAVVVKLDIQGIECYTFRNAERFLASLSVHAIIMEWSEMRRTGERHCVETMVNRLMDAGFRPFGVHGEVYTRKDLSDTEKFISDVIWKNVGSGALPKGILNGRLNFLHNSGAVLP